MNAAGEVLRTYQDRFGDVLRCPKCGSAVAAEPGAEGLLCTGGDCGRVAACRDGTIDYVSPEGDDRGDLSGFAYQWDKLFREPLAEAIAYNNTPRDLENLLVEMLEQKPEQFRGLRVLDVGCGHGQYCRVLARLGALPLGVDLSEVVYRCNRENVKAERLPATFLRADALNLPLAPGAFDVVLSIGMAMVTPDTKAAVMSGIRCIRPGGRLLLYIYETGAVGWVNLRYRFPLPSKLPRPLMLLCCRLMAVPLSFYLAGRARRLPTMRTWRTAVLGLLDAYLPRHHRTHPPEEISGWLREAGLEDIRRPQKCFYTARRPA
jgi:SAM-dependent methyltransferase